jgi:hypothetical protein
VISLRTYFPKDNLSPHEEIVRFGSFELDLRAGELRKQGVRIRLASICVSDS